MCMKKVAFFLVALACSTGFAQTLNQLSADVNGANAIPPNGSPWRPYFWIEYGSRYLSNRPQPPGAPQSGVLTSNTFGFQAYFTPSNLVNDLGIHLGAVTIESEAGAV